MKKLYFFLFNIHFFISSAQYTLTTANTPLPGDVESYQSVDTTGVYPGPAGTAQNWNYSGIVVTSTAVSSSTYVPISTVPNASLFPGATIGSYSGGSNYGVFDYSASWTYMGTATSNTMFCTIYGDPSTYYSYPFSYGSTSNDTYSFTTQYDTTSGNVVTIADATGTLQLPAMTHNNVLRVKRTLTENNVGASPYAFTGETYFFYSSSSKFPLLVMLSYTVNSGSGTFYSRSISVNVGVSTNISQLNDENPFKVYPNPVTSGRITLMGHESEEFDISVSNTLGQELKRTSSEELESNTMDVSGLEKGIYFVKIASSSGESIKKIIIE